jgi:uncharacterized protein (DUF2461 family)
MLALCDLLAPEFGSAKVFRPYRDVRFSKDKTPYKTAQGAVLGMADGAGAAYVQLSAAGLMRGRRLPRDGRRPGAALSRVGGRRDAGQPGSATCSPRIEQAGHTVEGERLKTSPRDYSEDHPRLRPASLQDADRDAHAYPPEPWLHTPEVADVMASHWREMSPLNTWLERNVGASHADATVSPRRRGGVVIGLVTPALDPWCATRSA